MKSVRSRFDHLAQAVRQQAETATREANGAGTQHRPSVALSKATEGLRERMERLEAELAEAGAARAQQRTEIERLRAKISGAGAEADEFLFLDAGMVDDTLPRDRLPGAFDGPEFQALLDDIRANGQNDAVTVRARADGRFEIAAGRRRLEACRRLGIEVLARRRDLDDAAMLRIQFSENERREDISALERARWFAEVQARLQLQGQELARQFGLDPSTFSLYLRLARFPSQITQRLRMPGRLAMLRARRVMEAVEADAAVLPRIVAALDAQLAAARGDVKAIDPDDQISLLMRTAEGRGGGLGKAAQPERRHIVHQGQRIGTLTRNGGQWVFRFATALPDALVQEVADKLPSLMPGKEGEV
ncbi:ParB/RepB/Spo0J family partition protein [Pseudoroseomonas globiformis]|uniref:ParB/RepB/Spo0J family partition protein n=1 Tax=Teichococcus globiformis TaxID=2307229 RepID=A0ABV7G8K0_9PROT